MKKNIALLFIYVVNCWGKKSPSNNYTDGNNTLSEKTNINAEFYMVNGIKHLCASSEKPCVRKCCAHGKVYDSVAMECQNGTKYFDFSVHNQDDRIQRKGAELFNFVIDNELNCSSGEFAISILPTSIRFYVEPDGKLHVETGNQNSPSIVRGPDKYCIDMFQTDTTVNELNGLYCYEPETETPPEGHQGVKISCMLVSCAFILATLVVYAWLPELWNLHGRVLVSYLTCLFLAFAFLATMQIMMMTEVTTTQNCTVLTFFIYFFLLAAFSWLNVMSFDIWWTFSGKGGLSINNTSKQAQFRWYALYAIGIPTGLTLLVTILEYSGLPNYTYLPRIRDQGCFLYGTSKMIYFYTPIIILCTANMVFFILTASKIAQIKRQTSVLRGRSDNECHNSDKQRLSLYIKLFVVMGINWILEVVSEQFPQFNNVWLVTDVYNILTGVFIFFIFVCKRKILRLMRERYNQRKGESKSRSQTTISTRDELALTSVQN